MKRQGVEGFTWDSDAEEWEAWCESVIEHNPPRSEHGREALHFLWHDYIYDLWLAQPRYRGDLMPTQRDLTTPTYSPPTRRKTPSYGAVIGVCGLVLVGLTYWGWS